MVYAKKDSYISSITSVCVMMFDKSCETRDRKMQHVVMMICSYLSKNVIAGRLYPNTWLENEYIDMRPIKEYISDNNIVLCDFSRIDIMSCNDADTERFILSYICRFVE
jgi:hypothetical protein